MNINQYYSIIKKDKLLYNDYFDFSRTYKLIEISKYGMIFEGYTDIAFPLDESYYTEAKCNCRLQLSDMGYLECELEEGHSGDHQFSHNGDSWPRRKYQITWERDEEKDFIFKEEHLSEINFEDVFVYIKDKYNILSYNYKFRDNSIHGSTPILWLNIEYNGDFEDTDEFLEILWDEESAIRAYLHDNLLFRGKQINRDTLSIHLSIYPKEENE